MNNTVKSLIIFSAGAAIGSAVTYLVTKNFFAKVAAEEISSVKEVYKRKIDDYEAKILEHKQQISDSEEENKLYRKAIKDAGYTVYSNFGVDEDEGPQDDVVDSHPVPPKAKPYIIDDQEYYTEAQKYEKHEYRYYAEDDTMCTEDDEIVEDPKLLLGEQAVDAIHKQHELHNNDLTYVRNDSLGADYEIQYMEGSYHELVLGMYNE